MWVARASVQLMAGSETMSNERLRAVHAYARAIASRDGLMARRAELSAEDVAQEIAFQYARLAEPPANWKGWTAIATRNRLIDLARQRRPAADPLEPVLAERIAGAMGPSAGVIAGHQVQEALAVLTKKERAVFGDHLAGMPNAELAQKYGYASAAAVATLVSRIARKVRDRFPKMELDLEPQRPY